jgi:hypothetical protein
MREHGLDGIVAKRLDDPYDARVSKRETPMTRRCWKRVGGTLLEE